jgi:hypothetical protein
VIRKFDIFAVDSCDLGDDEERDAMLLHDAMADIICDVAGPVADARFRKISLQRIFAGDGGRTDYQNADATASFFTCTHDPDSLLEECVWRARKLFREPRIWQATLVLGRNLQEREELTYKEVLGILQTLPGHTLLPGRIFEGGCMAKCAAAASVNVGVTCPFATLRDSQGRKLPNNSPTNERQRGPKRA